jgi:DnaJ-class molecular chaperone
MQSIPRGGGGGKDDGTEESRSSSSDDNDDKSSNDKTNKSSRGKKKKKSTRKKQPQPSGDESDENKDGQQQKRSAPSIQIVEEILQHDNFYEVLGVSHSASEREITKAYRKRCVQTHPDKTGGDRRAFDKVAEAYDCLSDSQKRSIYNRYGKAGLDGGGLGGAAAAAGGSYQDMFRSMFQQAAQQREQQQRRNQTLRYQLQVSLEDLYHGRTQTVTVSPPNFRHQPSSHRRQKQVDVHIPKGSVNGQSIVLSGEVDFNDDTPGDLIFVLAEARHPTFTRKGHDLAMEVEIGLEEALCGLRRPILHLNGEELWIESAKTHQGKPLVIQTGDVQVLKGWGMPKRNQNGEFGDLYIQYRVDMPKARNGNPLSEDELQELSRLLTKLQGSNRLSYAKGTLKRKNSKKNDGAGEDEQEQDDEEEIHRLLDAKVADFGVASGKVVWEDDDGFHGQDHGDDFHPFASAASSFFGGSSSGSRFYYSNFGGGDEDGTTQCQQM